MLHAHWALSVPAGTPTGSPGTQKQVQPPSLGLQALPSRVLPPAHLLDPSQPSSIPSQGFCSQNAPSPAFRRADSSGRYPLSRPVCNFFTDSFLPPVFPPCRRGQGPPWLCPWCLHVAWHIGHLAVVARVSLIDWQEAETDTRCHSLVSGCQTPGPHPLQDAQGGAGAAPEASQVSVSAAWPWPGPDPSSFFG